VEGDRVGRGDVGGIGHDALGDENLAEALASGARAG